MLGAARRPPPDLRPQRRGDGDGEKGPAAPLPAVSRMQILTRAASAQRMSGLEPNEAVSLHLSPDNTSARIPVPGGPSVTATLNPTTARSMCSSGEYQQSKQITKQNSNREQEEKEDTKEILWVPFAFEINRQFDPTADEDGPNRAIMLKTVWFVDFGTTHHVTSNQSLLVDGCYSPVDDGNGKDIFLHRANGEVVRVHGRGSVRTESIALDDVWYVPGLDSNYVSMGQLANLGCAFCLSRKGCRIIRGGALVGSGRFTDSRKFELDFLKVASSM